MAMVKYADARIVHPAVTKTQWANIRVAGKGTRVVAGKELNGNLIERASELMNVPFDPIKFLLTHATIIASVDVLTPPGVKTGSVLVDGFKVNRRYGNYVITPETDKYINNNNDAWSRGVLAKSYPTFIGGHNFVEHVQVEELSKGRLIDAVARDVGDSLYVDLLIATDLQHEALIKDIRSGAMSTLSMGCTVDGTICSKCGHWAADETEMCPHIKYMKGNTFYDEQGRRHRIAELCGHESLDPTGGVTFIEASWVGTPAFTGAVLRNVLEPTEVELKKVAEVLSTPPTQWAGDAVLKAASVVGADRVIPKKFTATERIDVTNDPFVAAEKDFPGRTGVPLSAFVQANDSFLAGWEDEVGDAGGDEAGGDAAAPAEVNPIDDMVKRLEDYAAKEVERRIRERMQKQDAPAATPPADSSMNETLMKQAAVRRYLTGLNVLVRTAASDAHLVDSLAWYNRQAGVDIPVQVYRAALMVGATSTYETVGDFRTACDKALGRKASLSEVKIMVRIGKLLSRRGTSGQGSRVGSRQGGLR